MNISPKFSFAFFARTAGWPRVRSIRWWRTGVGTALLGAFFGSSAVAAAQRDYVFVGRIDDRSVAQIENAINSGASRLIISSEGGDAPAALRLAKIVRSKSIAVVADKYCVSACASFLFVAGTKRSVTDGTLLGFHQTMTSMLHLAAARDRRLAQSLYGSLSVSEGDLYNRSGVSTQLLLAPAVAIHPICSGFKILPPRNADDFVFGSQWAIYSPSRKTLERYGLTFAGRIPANRTEAAAAMKRLPQSLRQRTWMISFDDPPVMAAPALVSTLENVADCRVVYGPSDAERTATQSKSSAKDKSQR